MPLWVGLPTFLADLAIVRVDHAIAKLRLEMQEAGMPNATRIFVGGHSLGAVAAQSYVSRHAAEKDIVSGAIMIGASLLRKYRQNFPFPWISIVGELDGLHRAMRVAESFYHFQLHSEREDKDLVQPVVVVEGMNHMAFTTGKPPKNVRQADLKSTISGEEARARVADLIVAFMSANSDLDQEGSYRSLLSDAVVKTAEFVAPLITSLEMEGSYHLKRPCNSDTPSPHCPYYPAWPLPLEPRVPSEDTTCGCGGTPWSKVAVTTMANLSAELYPVHSEDSAHDVRDTHPFHHAHVWNNCTYQATPCMLNLTTVSELDYSETDEEDKPFSSVAANEIKMKMKSRQLYRRSTVNPFETFDVDKNNVCAEINEKAYNWALETASPTARQRFLSSGMSMKFLNDFVPPPIGPLWINSKLRMREEYDMASRRRVMKVQAVTMRTDLDSWINSLHPDAYGQHYCKLLSPAMAMEWIYTTGLVAGMKRHSRAEPLVLQE